VGFPPHWLVARLVLATCPIYSSLLRSVPLALLGVGILSFAMQGCVPEEPVGYASYDSYCYPGGLDQEIINDL